MTQSEQGGAKMIAQKGTNEILTLDAIHDTFIRNVSHEFRTPLAVLLGYAEVLYTGELGTLSPEQQRAVSVIVNRSHELKRAVTRINTLLAVQAHKCVRHFLVPASFVTPVIEAQRGRAEASGITLELHLSTELPLVIGDAEQLQLALECLVENAIKFTPRGGRINVHLWADFKWVNLSVQDTGIGIAGEDMGRLFAPFVQLDDSPSRTYGGLGLGLTLARSIVIAHGGEIVAESLPGEGSCFTIRIPSSPPAENSLHTGPQNEVTRRILIVDDEEGVAFTLREGLRKLPRCDIAIALSGRQALDLFAEQPFDLLITDYKMPDLSGVALASCIEQHYPNTNIILITAYGHDLVQDLVSVRAIRHVLHKPIRLTEIRDVAMETLALQA